MNFQALNRQRKMILIAALVGLISVFLPWFTISAGGLGNNLSVSTNGFHGSGIIVLLAFAASLIMALTGEPGEPLRSRSWIITLGLGVIALLFVGINMSNLSGASGGYGIVQAGYGFGLWIALAASLAILAAGWLYKNPSDSLKLAFEDLKKNISSPPAPKQGPGGSNTNMAELERLIELRNQNKITEEEFIQMKSKLL